MKLNEVGIYVFKTSKNLNFFYINIQLEWTFGEYDVIGKESISDVWWSLLIVMVSQEFF